MRLEDLFTLLLSFVALAPLCGVLFGIVASVFWIITLVDCMKTDLPDKTAWVLVIIFLGPLGALMYYFVVQRQRPPATAPARSNWLEPRTSKPLGTAYTRGYAKPLLERRDPALRPPPKTNYQDRMLNVLIVMALLLLAAVLVLLATSVGR
jgi:hypothetical protein